MKNAKVTLAPLEAGDHEQFILDNQESFKYGAVEEFGLRDDHFEEDGEIISRATIEQSIDAPDSEVYRYAGGICGWCCCNRPSRASR